ncbi:zinc knuckle CX2CX4HX4C containing protein [Tanacetum coccineum]
MVKILGRDGKPMVARRYVRFSKTTKESACGDGHDVIVDSSKVEHSPQAVAECAVHDDGTRPVHGRNDTRVNDLNSHTNDAPVEHVISSAVCLPMEAIDEIKARFVNTLYGFPVGKRLAFPMVENYVKYAWAKYGLKRVMMHHGFFMFQFDSDSGMVKVMEDGPWRIQLVPIILNVWRPNTLLQKDKVTHVSLWLKMHNVPIVAYSKVGLDLISAKVGRLMRLDAHTNFICLNSWGRSDYARALVEVSADKPLVDSVDIDIPREDGNGYTTANIRIEFEWQPPRCGTCKIFDHLDSVCPIKRVAGPSKQSDMQADVKKDKQLVQATSKKGKGKQVGDKNVASNTGQSLDTTKKPSPSDSSMNGMSSFINDDISLEELRNFVDKSMQEESVLEQVGNYDINGCTSREKQGEKVSSKKSSSSLEILNEDSDTDVDEVFVPKVRTTFPSSSGGAGHQLEEDAYDDYEDQFEDYPSLHQEFCDQFDFKVKGLGSNIIILAAQSVPKFQSTRRCNNYAVLQSISCSPECKIMEQILLDHPLSYALTATYSELDLLLEEKLDEEEIEKMVEDEEDEELYASEFVDFVFNDDDDSGNKIEPEKKDDNKEDKKDDDVEKMDEVVEEKDNDDHTDHTLARSHATCSMETRNKQMQTPISTPTRSPRKDLSSDKTISEELTATVSPTTATTSKDSSKLKIKRGFNSNKTKILPGSIAGMCRRRGQIRTHIKTKFMTHEFFIGKIREVLDHCNGVVPEMTFSKTYEMIKEEMP